MLMLFLEFTCKLFAALGRLLRNKKKLQKLPVRFAASAIRKVVQDRRKNKAVSNNGKSEIFVSFVTCMLHGVKDHRKMTIQMKVISSIFLWCCLLCCTR